MVAPGLPNFLIKWVYPAALTALNTYFLRNKIKEVEDVLGMRIMEVETDMEDCIKRLTARQTELERAFSHMAAAEKLLKDCGEKCAIDERSLPVHCALLCIKEYTLACKHSLPPIAIDGDPVKTLFEL